MQSIKWYKAAEGQIVKEVDEVKMPLDSLESPRAGITVYKHVNKEVTYTRGKFPSIARVEKIVGIDYKAVND